MASGVGFFLSVLLCYILLKQTRRYSGALFICKMFDKMKEIICTKKEIFEI